jgi:hypothetical protein
MIMEKHTFVQSSYSRKWALIRDHVLGWVGVDPLYTMLSDSPQLTSLLEGS